MVVDGAKRDYRGQTLRRLGRAAGVRALHQGSSHWTFDWIARHGTFAEGGMGHGRYQDSVFSLQKRGVAGLASLQKIPQYGPKRVLA
jgi:hypothetical protein